MIVTEEEAKTKVCCGGDGCGQIVRMPNLGLVEDGYERRCLGSLCMAWCWQDNLSPEHQRGDGGYCGKAGKQ